MRRLILIALLLVAGCGKSAVDRPPTIRYGTDICGECRMIIGDKRFAAAFVDEQGEFVKFDDIGCMRMHQGKAGTTPKNFWVHDYVTEEWVGGREAFFVLLDGVITPMGYGVVAYKVGPRTEKTIAWEDMLEILKTKSNQTKGENARETKS